MTLVTDGTTYVWEVEVDNAPEDFRLKKWLKTEGYNINKPLNAYEVGDITEFKAKFEEMTGYTLVVLN